MSNSEQVYTTYIRSTEAKVWEAITNPEFTHQYWGNNNISDWKKGAKWEHISYKGDKPAVFVTGKVLECTPPRRLVLSWAAPDALADESKVTFEIEQIADMVKLVVIHGDFKPGSDMSQRVSQGWPRVLSSMKSFLETGKPLDMASLKSCSQAA